MKKFDEQTYALALRIVRFNHPRTPRTMERIDALKEGISKDAAQCGYVVWCHGYSSPTPYLSAARGPLDNAVTAIERSKKHHPTPFATRRAEAERRKTALYWNEKRYRKPGPMHHTPAKRTANVLWILKNCIAVGNRAGEIAYYAESYTEALRDMKEEALARMNYPEQVAFTLHQERPDLLF